MILASMSTRNFDFAAIADTSENADRLLKEAWEKHCQDYSDADPEAMGAFIALEEVNYVEVKIGTVLRDGEPIHNAVIRDGDRTTHRP